MRVLLVAALLAALLAPAVTIAGTTGELTGTVRLSYPNSQSPIAGATVTITSEVQNERTTTDARGYFCFVSLAPGSYVVSVSRYGYETTNSTVLISADNESWLTVELRSRIVRVVVDGPWLMTNFVRQGIVSDVYSIPAEWPFYSFDGHDIYALHFIPGLTFGAGPVLSR
ncbi:MAG: carboxypeptidase-like regulatory domain-containing protein [Candidatus Tumulicola sp.]